MSQGRKGSGICQGGPRPVINRARMAFMADTDLLLEGRVSVETLSAIHAAGYDYEGGAVIPMPGKEETGLSKDVILTPEQIAAEERRWLFEAPIAELAEVKGVTIDEAVKMRTDAMLREAVPIEVSVRPIEPQGKLIGFASVARAEAVRPAPIREQMAQAAKEAGKENAARSAPAKKKEARDDR